MNDGLPMDLPTLERLIDRMDEPATRALAATLHKHLRPVAPVTPDTRRALKTIEAGDEGPPELIDALEAMRDTAEAEYFALDAENDEEAPLIFRHARAVSALLHALKAIYADAVYEAQMAVENPRAMITEMGLA